MKTVSLELAKQLKEKGYPQGDSHFYWDLTYTEPTLTDDCIEEDQSLYITAPTADEILDLLPLYLKTDADKGISFSVETCGLNFYKSYDNKRWIINYQHIVDSDESLADAAAKMWIYLKENDLLGVK